MKNSKATTLEFESDFDFESANAQFKDDLTKKGVAPFLNMTPVLFDLRRRKLS